MFASSKSGAVADPKDAQFNYVTMLLHGNGTNGAQNNTFVDSSTNNFTITRNGNTTQGTFSPYGSNWSNYFDGSGDYLSVADANALDFSGDFTVEAWVFVPTTSGNARTIIHKADTNVGYALVMIPAGNIEVQCTSLQFNSTSTLPLNQWNHVAMVRSGSGTNNVKFYLNGVLDGQGTNTTNTASSVTLGIGAVARSGAAGVNPINGYISNVRLVASAVYTSAFTPSTTPLTAITNTSLLTCADNRLIDDSTNNFTITRNGDVSVQRFSPFSPTSAYSTSVIGGSGYFDGSGDYLSLPTSQTPLSLGSSDFTFEAWVYRSSGTGGAYIFVGQSDLNTIAGSGYDISVGASGSSNLYSGSGTVFSVTNPNAPVGAWSHVAWVRTGGTFSSYLNGTRVSTVGTLGTSSINSGATNYPPTIGALATGSGALTGFIAGARLIKGSGGYDATQSTITVPTAPPTAVTNTSLLMNYTNAGILDNAMMNDLETVGNAQISTSVKKYGTGSMSFDGSGDYLISRASPIWLFSGDWTMEAWIYPNSVTGVQVLIETRNRTTNASPCMYLNGTNLVIDTGTASVVSAGTITISTWQHVAATRSGNSWRIFINGTQVGSTTTNTTSYTTAYGCCIGSSYYNEHYNGYIDDLRITQGLARYTASFTAPSAPYADKG